MSWISFWSRLAAQVKIHGQKMSSHASFATVTGSKVGKPQLVLVVSHTYHVDTEKDWDSVFLKKDGTEDETGMTVKESFLKKHTEKRLARLSAWSPRDEVPLHLFEA